MNNKFWHIASYVAGMGLAAMLMFNQPAQASTQGWVTNSEKHAVFDDDGDVQIVDEFRETKTSHYSSSNARAGTYKDYVDDTSYRRPSANIRTAAIDECEEERRRSPDFFSYGCSIWDTMRHGGSNNGNPTTTGKSPCGSYGGGSKRG